jgi:cell division transport system permease protein
MIIQFMKDLVPELFGEFDPAHSTRRTSQIMPDSGVSGHTLTIVMTIMCYLACLALGALIIINKSIDNWTSDISGQVTVQVRPVSGSDIEAEISKAVAIIEATDGVTAVNVLSAEEAAELLEPWLGSDEIIQELPIPRLIEVSIDRQNPPDLFALAERLKTEIVGASLDTHRRWQDQLVRAAGTLRMIGYSVLVLISVTTMAIVVFATRAALYSNRQIVEVLHLVGARDNFIAVQVQRHFLRLGLKGGLIGAVVGAISFTAVNMLATDGASGLAENIDAIASGTYNFSIANYLLLLLIPLVATLISLITARLAIMRILGGVL